MKIIFKTLAVITAVSATLGCQKDNFSQDTVKKTIDMHVIADHGGSKTVLVEENEKLVPYWTEGDQIRVLELLYSKFEKDPKEWTGPDDWPEMWYWSEPIAQESKVADFVVQMDAREKLAEEQYHYLAVYPASSFSSYEWTGNEAVMYDWRKRWSEMAPDIQGLDQIPAHPTAIVEIPIDQNPVPGCFDPRADVLVSDILNSDTQPESVNMAFARVGSILKINFTGLPEGFQPENGELKCDESWPAAYLMEYDPYLHKVGVYSKPSNWIRFSLWKYPECAKDPIPVWLRTISGTVREWFTVSIRGHIGKEEAVFVKNVNLKTPLNIPEGKVTEIDVELIQGYTVNAYLDNQVIGESSISGTMCYEISGPEFSSAEYGVLFTEGEYYEEHDPSWQKTILSVDGNGQAAVNFTALKPNTYYTIAPYVILDGQTYWTGNSVKRTKIHYSYTEPDAVDLGLSVKWASFNLGATSPSEAGYYFAWAETEPRTISPGYDHKWSNSNKYVIQSGDGQMDSADDAAAVNLGNGWRIPTRDEWLELKYDCTWTEEILDEVAGIRATSTKNGNSIFFPYAGYADYSYENPRYNGTRAGLMTNSYTTGRNCWEVTLPWSYDFYTHSMVNTLVSVRGVK